MPFATPGEGAMKRIQFAAMAALLCAGAAQADYVVNPFSLPGAPHSTTWGINDLGHLVGEANDGTNGWGFVYSGGAVTRLDGPAGSTFADAMGISNTGVVVGNWFDAANGVHPYAY